MCNTMVFISTGSAIDVSVTPMLFVQQIIDIIKSIFNIFKRTNIETELQLMHSVFIY